MEVAPSDDVRCSPASAVEPTGQPVVLVDGTAQHLDGLGPEELTMLQWEQETAFARAIEASPKGSRERAEITRLAYDTVTAIFGAATNGCGGPLVMGMHPRNPRFVIELLDRQRRRGMRPSLFEIGYGAGVLLDRVAQSGYPAAGIEVSAAMREEAHRRVDPSCLADLLLGDFLRRDFSDVEVPYTLVYWNDVFEHVPPDEILEYLARIRELLVPGGQLVTVTPNWHERPSDVTACVRPPRTESAGLHLKEYTLRQVTELLNKAGFDRVATPLFVTSRRIYLFGDGLARPKRLFEPCLEFLPFRPVPRLCRGLALNCTIATKGDR